MTKTKALKQAYEQVSDLNRSGTQYTFTVWSESQDIWIEHYPMNFWVAREKRIDYLLSKALEALGEDSDDTYLAQPGDGDVRTRLNTILDKIADRK